ncbi:hypothetical protein FJ527_26400 [Mesorhizobium sp. B2-4-18]|uniref:hypothetical protein n=1 Tax=Mesorhizobium sp. B2-4-18 TaxID=2589931 RepID=UPI00112CD2D2|nr:hypothetical protein [Mesorhizobium sp. B2-4-18]TPK71576.1 hypothetical protein FJ527_26400 [Mesorhizobium sp. B2-4-18]
MSATQIFNILGLVLTLVGVVVLFRYGMPYKVRSGGMDLIGIEQTNQNEIALEKRYDLFGNCGLVCIIAGTILQIAANVI